MTLLVSILAHGSWETWILFEQKQVKLWNKSHFVENKLYSTSYKRSKLPWAQIYKINFYEVSFFSALTYANICHLKFNTIAVQTFSYDFVFSTCTHYIHLLKWKTTFWQLTEWMKKLNVKMDCNVINININSHTYKIQLTACQADAKKTLSIITPWLTIAVRSTARTVGWWWGEVWNTVHQPEASISPRHNHTFSVAQCRAVCLIWWLIIVQDPQ
jgi:hypothetical protein